VVIQFARNQVGHHRCGAEYDDCRGRKCHATTRTFIGEVGEGELIVSNATMMTADWIGVGTNSQGSLTLKTNGR